jgi:hypothetical protein
MTRSKASCSKSVRAWARGIVADGCRSAARGAHRSWSLTRFTSGEQQLGHQVDAVGVDVEVRAAREPDAFEGPLRFDAEPTVHVLSDVLAHAFRLARDLIRFMTA